MTRHPYRSPDEEALFAIGQLETRGAPLPLQRLDLHARLWGLHAHVTLEQLYRNDREEVLEVVYVFPAPALGAITSYSFAIDGITHRGVLLERDEARARYDVALAAGHAASTLEEDRPEVLTVRIGNLTPGATAQVRIGLDLLLPVADDCAVLRLPLLVGARYVPGTPLGTPPVGAGTASDTVDAPDASRVTPPLAAAAPRGRGEVVVNVTVDAFGVEEVVASHPVELDHHDGALRIRAVDLVPDGDVVLRFPIRNREAAWFVPDASGVQGTLVATFCATGSAAPPPLEVAILIDRSGSMEGRKLVAARRAAVGIVESLSPRDRMMVIAFDHQIEAPLGTALVPATASRRRRATEFLDTLEAEGGTELAAPLGIVGAAFRAQAPDSDRSPAARPRRRVIVLVTDGQVANEDQLVALVGTIGVEVLAVAIGAAANQGLCQRLAARTGGAYEAAEAEGMLAAALERTLRRLLSPTLEELELSIEDATLIPGTRVPRHPPRLVAGVPAVLAARVTGRPSSVELHAVDADGARLVRRILVEQLEAPALPRVWARMRVRDLEDELASSEFPGGLALEDELVATSLQFGVLSRYTAFVAVDAQPIRSSAPRTRIVQPVAAIERSFGGAGTTQAGRLNGKIAYLSPEQIRGLPAGAASDVFVLGTLLFELATLTRLFRGETDYETVLQIRDARRPSLPPRLAALEPILGRALARDPAARFADAGELLRELAALDPLASLAPLASERAGLGALVERLARPAGVRGPIRSRRRGLWIAEQLSESYGDTSYRAIYAGPIDDPWPDAFVRVMHHRDEYRGDPLPIAHAGIARVLGVSDMPQRLQVIEYVPGIDLGALMRGLHAAASPLSIAQIIAIATDVAEALAAIHACGAVHHRLTPRSFVLTPAGRAVLVELPAAPPGTELPPLTIPLRGLGRYLR